MKRLAWTIASLSVFVLACHGRGGGAGSTKRPLVGVTLLTQTQDFYKDLEQGLREEAKARGLDLTITACEMDPAKQASQIEDFIKFPPRQKPAAFNLDEVMRKLQESSSASH